MGNKQKEKVIVAQVVYKQAFVKQHNKLKTWPIH